MTTATIYTRVSSREQVTGYSLDAQLQSCRDFAARNGWKLASEFHEAGASGRTRKKRPQLDLAIREVCHNKGVLVFYSLSRLARSVQDSLDIARAVNDCGGHLVSVTDSIDTTTASGRMVFAILAAVCRMESDIIGERVKQANEASIRKNGYRTQGRTPYGYCWHEPTGERRPCREEKLVIAKAASFRRDGLTYARIAGELNDLGIPSPESRRGGEGKWHGETVRRVLATR